MQPYIAVVVPGDYYNHLSIEILSTGSQVHYFVVTKPHLQVGMYFKLIDVWILKVPWDYLLYFLTYV